MRWTRTCVLSKCTTIAGLVGVAATATELLAQGTGVSASGLGTGEVILVGLQSVVLIAVAAVYRRQENGEKRDAEGRKDLHNRLEAKVKELHDRMDRMVDTVAEAAQKNADRLGRLEERMDVSREDLIGISTRIDGIGSKISNQVERALESRAEDTDRRFVEMGTRIDRVIAEKGRRA